MSTTVISSSSNSIEKDIDEYHDTTSYSSSSNSSQSSSDESTTDEGYTSGVLGVPLEVLQEQLRRTSGPQAGTSSNNPLSSPLDEIGRASCRERV